MPDLLPWPPSLQPESSYPMSDLTTADTVATTMRLFPGAVIVPNTGCAHCQSCQLITETRVGVKTIHHPDCVNR